MSDHTQLARVLGMLGSQHDGEVLNAARLAEKLRKRLDRSWASLLSGPGPSPQATAANDTDTDLLIRALDAENKVEDLQEDIEYLEEKLATTKRELRDAQAALPFKRWAQTWGNGLIYMAISCAVGAIAAAALLDHPSSPVRAAAIPNPYARGHEGGWGEPKVVPDKLPPGWSVKVLPNGD